MKNKEKFIGFREDTEDYFKWCTGVDHRKPAFSPFIIIKNGCVYTEWYWRNLLNGEYDFLTDEDIIMQVWPGHWKCDCFIFTIGELREYVRKNLIN